MIDRRTSFERPEATQEELDAILAFCPDGWLDLAALSETRDAPPIVMGYVERWERAKREWEAGASERRLEYAHDRYAVRMFGGPWIPVSMVVECDGFRCRPVEAYIDSISDGEGADSMRRKAAAIYEWVERSEAIGRELFEALRPGWL